VLILPNSPLSTSSKIPNFDRVSRALCGGANGVGIKEYSEWPTIPQLYVRGEFVGGCDIVMNMHQSGELEKVLEDAKVLVPIDLPEEPEAEEKPASPESK
jgi:hypothetical protein